MCGHPGVSGSGMGIREATDGQTGDVLMRCAYPSHLVIHVGAKVFRREIIFYELNLGVWIAVPAVLDPFAGGKGGLSQPMSGRCAESRALLCRYMKQGMLG